jgi:hypothetical protein
MRLVAGALVVRAVAVVAAAFIVSRRTVNVNIQGPLTVCNTQNINDVFNGC